MDLYKYYTEEELGLLELEQEMQFMPSQQSQYDYMLGSLYASLIKRMVKARYPRTWRTVSTLAVNALATEIAERCGFYQISLMPYEALVQAWHEQSYRLVLIKKLDKNEYFALIDDKARQIGVHIPKSHKQIRYEKMISGAIKDLNVFLKRKNINPDPEIQSFITEELWKRNLGSFEAIKVRPTKKELSGSVLVMSNHKKLQMFFDKEKATMYYHIAK